MLAEAKKEEIKPKYTKRYIGIVNSNTVFVQDGDSDMEKLDLAKDVYKFTTEDIKWGSVCPRSKQLTLAILTDLLKNPNEAFEYNDALCYSIISLLDPNSDWELSEFQIRQLLRSLELSVMSAKQSKGLPIHESKEEMDDSNPEERSAIFETKYASITKEDIKTSLNPKKKINHMPKMPKNNGDMTQFDADALIAMGRALTDKPDNGKKPK